MTDNMGEILQELSGLLRRITEQNDASGKRQEEFRLRMEGQKDFRAKSLEDFETRREQFRTQTGELRSNADKSKETLERRQEQDRQSKERLLQTLDQHNQLLDTLIARLKDNAKKGPL